MSNGAGRGRPGRTSGGWPTSPPSGPLPVLLRLPCHRRVLPPNPPWRESTSRATPLVLSALDQALFTRRRTNVESTADGCCTTPTPDLGTHRWRSLRPSSTPGSPARSAPSVTPSTTHYGVHDRPVQDRGHRPRAARLAALGEVERVAPSWAFIGTATNACTPRSAASHRPSTNSSTTLQPGAR